MIGQDIAQWLRDNVKPEKLYDHAILLTDLGRYGIFYDEQSHMLFMPDGSLAEMLTYTPAELLKHPWMDVYEMTDRFERLVVGIEVAQSLHSLLWPLEAVPGYPQAGLTPAYNAIVSSIAQRGRLAYRDTPAKGWR